MNQTAPRKKIILITIIMSAILVGLIALFVVAATRKKAPAEPEIPNTTTEIAGEYTLEEEKADPTSASTEEKTPAESVPVATATTETSTTLPKTGPTSLVGLSLVAGFATYLGTTRLVKRLA